MSHVYAIPMQWLCMTIHRAGVHMQAAASHLERELPNGIDVLINNAGILSDHVTHLEMCVHAAP